jgi:hypothetical protein
MLLPLLLLPFTLLAEPTSQGSALFQAVGQDPYFQGKRGFPTIEKATYHAYKEFQREVARGRLDPRTQEYYSYFYTFHEPGAARELFLHTAWRQAVIEGAEDGSVRHSVTRPLVESGVLRVYSMIHSHPTVGQGAGPSRVDVALASRYRNADGTFRHLYLINNFNKLIQFKAVRAVDPGNRTALLAMPAHPRKGVEWLD